MARKDIFKERITSWTMNRKDFVRSISLLAISSTVFHLDSCVNTSLKDENLISSLMSNEEAKIIIDIQNILLPETGKGPSAKDINAFHYLLWFLQDERIDSRERNYHISGANKVNRRAKEIYKRSFTILTPDEKEKLIQIVSKEPKIKFWLSKHLTLIFEALLCDPIYGGNPDKIGWSWLHHNPGKPRPVKELAYPDIINHVQRNQG